MQSNATKMLGLLCTLAGIACVAFAALYNEYFLSFLDSNPPLASHTVNGIRHAQANMAVVGLVLILMGDLLYPRRLQNALQRIFRRPLAVNVAVVLLVLALPLFVAEWALRPFALPATKKTTSLFVEDDVLGWKLHAGAKEIWGNVLVEVNRRGLRGPALDNERREGTLRILYLGDSVTFGYRIPHHSQTFPYLIEMNLEEGHTTDVETINAGVGGYSPWQYYHFLQSQGFGYNPDLVVIDFVLNDVTEKYRLRRFGGGGVGAQLSSSYYSLSDWLSYNSGIYAAALRVRSRLGFSDVHNQAVQAELLSVRQLIEDPDNHRILEAWARTQDSLTLIIEACRERDIPVIIVMFPFTFQFEDVAGSSLPQRILMDYAAAHDVPVLNLLPLIDEYIRAHGLTTSAMFLDNDHLTPLGNRVVAGHMADFVENEPQLTPLWRRVGE